MVDRHVVPAHSEEEQSFVERLLVLPHSRWCYRPVPWMPELTEPPGLNRGWITFGCLNSSAKLHPELLSCWAELLQRVPGSRLLVKNYQLRDQGLQAAIHSQFQQCGVAPERLILQGPSVHVELLAVYAEIDVALDPFAFNGGLTSCEALWMGLPLVSLEGRNRSCVMAGHQGAALLREIGRGEWITQSQADYLELAERLAADPAELAPIRRSQRSAMRASALCNKQGLPKGSLRCRATQKVRFKCDSTNNLEATELADPTTKQNAEQRTTRQSDAIAMTAIKTARALPMPLNIPFEPFWQEPSSFLSPQFAGRNTAGGPAES